MAKETRITLEDDVGLKAARQKLASLESKKREIEAKLAEASQRREIDVLVEAESILSGKPKPPQGPTASDFQQQLTVIEKAIVLQTRLVEAAHGEALSELHRQWAILRRPIVARIALAVGQMREALGELLPFENGLIAAGGRPDALTYCGVSVGGEMLPYFIERLDAWTESYTRGDFDK